MTSEGWPVRYYFHAGDGAIVRDTDGELLANDRAAANTAVDVLAEMLPTQRDLLWETHRFSVAVKDETGRLVAVLTTTALLDPDRAGDMPPSM